MTWMATTNRFTEPGGALRMGLFLQILDRFRPGRLLDLGTGHGLFARLAADRGWDVVAVDARDERFPDDGRVKWIKQDVREASLEGFDVIACLGLWYHLTLADQTDLAKRADGTALILDTHVALAHTSDHGKRHKGLSRLRHVGGYEGRLYAEKDLQDRYTASFGNEASFWPTEASLRSLLTTSGYDVVETFEPPVLPDRRYFLATRLTPEQSTDLDGAIAKYIRLA